MKKLFLFSVLAQRKSEICGISWRQIFNIKKSLLHRGRISIYLDNFQQRSLSRLILRWFFFCGSSLQLSTFDIILAECKQLTMSPLITKNTLWKWWRKLRFCISCIIIKPLVYQQFGDDVVPSACNFIKNTSLAQLFTCEFWDIFQQATLIKTRLQHRNFLVKFDK